MCRVAIREYEDSDWLVTCSIHDRARAIELKGTCDEKAFVPLAEDVNDLESFTLSQKFVACINEQVVGFVGIRDCEVTWLYVDPNEFHKGIGRQLLKHGLEKIRDKAETYVLEGNLYARNLYESEGFKVITKFNSHSM
ncbi:GNAT family N-acetyltransferase [Grimontia sp. S25]|uniref:GNAT family N-acetyltransferase n=1 Tax=Grimontia sedimenti TaxID=2711294 RepID=A0A6M1RG48_9GAMM|nr:GNAT family N-acetyltransferase [Grimontia sedimenti]NGN96568.1 GNAT family N-acetyltransferase [Grimontia sedimenti]